jgi:predicted XRE-type DNA-binding protein
VTNLKSDDELAVHEALKAILAGPIVVTLTDHPILKRSYYVGELRFAAHRIARSLLRLEAQNETAEMAREASIRIEFRERSESERKAAMVWELVQQGLSQKEIAPIVGVTKGRISALMKVVAQQFGSGLSVKQLLRNFRRPRTEPLLHETLIEPVMERFQRGMLLVKIAEELDTHRDMVTAAVAEWHRRQGLPVPDGRTRRIGLEHKGRPRSRAGQSPESSGAA